MILKVSDINENDNNITFCNRILMFMPKIKEGQYRNKCSDQIFDYCL